jgi:hypothetical protein
MLSGCELIDTENISLEAYFEYFESCDFSGEITNIDVSVFMLDLRMIHMSSECEYE